MTCLRDSPLRFSPSVVGKNTFVAMTTSSREACRRSNLPVTSSLTPREYMSAVSKVLMPSSSARVTKGSAASSPSTHSRQAGSP